MFGVWKPWVWTAWIRVCCLIPSIFAYIYPPKLPSFVGKKTSPIEESGICYQKMNQNFVRLCSRMFPSFSEVLGHFMPLWCKPPPDDGYWRFLVCVRSLPLLPKWIHAAGARSNTLAWLNLGTAAVLKKTLFSRWWQLKDFLFSPLFGEMIQFD